VEELLGNIRSEDLRVKFCHVELREAGIDLGLPEVYIANTLVDPGRVL
jgi:hypothetical protein